MNLSRRNWNHDEEFMALRELPQRPSRRMVLLPSSQGVEGLRVVDIECRVEGRHYTMTCTCVAEEGPVELRTLQVGDGYSPEDRLCVGLDIPDVELRHLHISRMHQHTMLGG